MKKFYFSWLHVPLLLAALALLTWLFLWPAVMYLIPTMFGNNDSQYESSPSPVSMP